MSIITFKQTVSTLVCVSSVGLSGCATTAEMERLRAEVAQANATALQAVADAAQTRRELIALKAAKAADKSAPTVTSRHGYKWSLQDSWRASPEAH